jgi:hypothetical protein
METQIAKGRAAVADPAPAGQRDVPTFAADDIRLKL